MSVDKGECQRITLCWQVGHKPNCNAVHKASYSYWYLLNDRTPDQLNVEEQKLLDHSKAFDWLQPVRTFLGNFGHFPNMSTLSAMSAADNLVCNFPSM
jgi:hypothetical protein